ncbi:MAG: hypothetical protein WAV20_23465 [Blastocatellia bacterium]
MLKRVLFLLLTILIFAAPVYAQNNAEKEKFEVGIQFSLLKQGNGVFIFGPTSVEFVNPHVDRTALGLGGRTVYNLNRFLSLEAEVNVFPEQNIFGPPDIVCCGFGTVIDGLIVEGLAGTKVGLRKRRIGVYGRARPGFLHFGRTLGECTAVLVGVQCKFDKGRTDFVVDVGGSLELYVSDRWLMRFDVGDIIQFFPGLRPVRIPPGLPFLPADTKAQTYHSFQFSSGVGFRF